MNTNHGAHGGIGFSKMKFWSQETFPNKIFLNWLYFLSPKCVFSEMARFNESIFIERTCWYALTSMLNHGLCSHIEEAKAPNMFCAYKLKGSFQPHLTRVTLSNSHSLLTFSSRFMQSIGFSRSQGNFWSSVWDFTTLTQAGWSLL